MIARSMTHRYIIRTYSVEQRIDADDLGKFVFICMELIKSRLELGHVIEERRAAGQKLRLNEVLHISRQLLDALAYAHEYTIHRDIKPGNIMLVPHDEQSEMDSSDLTKFDIRLIDFGIAKVLSQKHIDVTGQGFRSAHYGAPELADIKTGVDVRADIYSVGVMMYQMLTMNIPRKGSPPANKVNKEIPVALAKIIDKSINADREKRFKTISEFTKEIDKAVSKFNWLRKAAKIAAVLLVGIGISAAVKYFIPEPDELPLQQSIELLKDRKPDKEITTLANATVVRYADIAGFAPYDSLRQIAVEKLETVAGATGDDKFKRNYAPWEKQEEVWGEIEPTVEKIESFAKDQREYNARRNLTVADHLTRLEPSSEIVSQAKEKAQQAEVRLALRPLKQDDVDFCAEAYDLGAKVYTNIETLAEGSEAFDTAEQINNKLKNVQKLQNDFLLMRDSLDVIEPLKGYGFDERRVKCLEKADRYYRSFELSRL
jgi:serine/threonine protein kinase